MKPHEILFIFIMWLVSVVLVNATILGASKAFGYFGFTDTAHAIKFIFLFSN